MSSRSLKILMITDAWHPQINGVVTMLHALENELQKAGHHVVILGPNAAHGLTCRMPSYPEVFLDFFAIRRLIRELERLRPDIIHIATEGPLGWQGRYVCLQKNLPFTTSYHTRFPEYLSVRSPRLFQKWVRAFSYRMLRHFHMPARTTLVPTPTILNDLVRNGFQNLVLWPPGVDLDLFQPRPCDTATVKAWPRPYLLYVGRLATEKNLPAFLDLKTLGTKIVVGDGPDRHALMTRYPHTIFLGALKEQELASVYASADLFVFPSKTDTFGLVLLEACASGLRIAAFPVSGPVDLFSTNDTKTFAVLKDDLAAAVEHAIALAPDPAMSRGFAGRYSWSKTAEIFLQAWQTGPQGHRTPRE